MPTNQQTTQFGELGPVKPHPHSENAGVHIAPVFQKVGNGGNGTARKLNYDRQFWSEFMHFY